MRTLLAFAALILVVVPGCGDDTTSNLVTDMAAATMDLATSGADMAKRTCGQVAVCANNCTTPSCITACVASGSTDAMTRFGVFSACLAVACGPGDGGSGMCPIPPDTSTTCQTCLKTTGQAAQTDPNAPCHAQLTDCLAH
jgi:hypothetical protein